MAENGLLGINVLTLFIEGKVHTFAAPIGNRDPMEMTLGEWRSAPLLSANAMLAKLFSAPRSSDHNDCD